MVKTFPLIAIVDDDQSVLNALLRLVRTRAFHAKAYGSAEEFLATLPDELPQCLIVDLQMPEMSGLELLRHLMLKGIQIPTIIITAHSETGVRERCEAAGAVGFLLKPLEDTVLFAAIERSIRTGDSRYQPM